MLIVVEEQPLLCAVQDSSTCLDTSSILSILLSWQLKVSPQLGWIGGTFAVSGATHTYLFCKREKNSFMEKRYSYILAYRVKIELVLKIRNHNGSTVEQLLWFFFSWFTRGSQPFAYIYFLPGYNVARNFILTMFICASYFITMFLPNVLSYIQLFLLLKLVDFFCHFFLSSSSFSHSSARIIGIHHFPSF